MHLGLIRCNVACPFICQRQLCPQNIYTSQVLKALLFSNARLSNTRLVGFGQICIVGVCVSYWRHLGDWRFELYTFLLMIYEIRPYKSNWNYKWIYIFYDISIYQGRQRKPSKFTFHSMLYLYNIFSHKLTSPLHLLDWKTSNIQ